jgi:hypothetical protein
MTYPLPEGEYIKARFAMAKAFPRDNIGNMEAVSCGEPERINVALLRKPSVQLQKIF